MVFQYLHRQTFGPLQVFCFYKTYKYYYYEFCISLLVLVGFGDTLNFNNYLSSHNNKIWGTHQIHVEEKQNKYSTKKLDQTKH